MPESLEAIMNSPELSAEFHVVYPQPEIPRALVKKITVQYHPNNKIGQETDVLSSPYAYIVELTTHRMLYQDVLVESKIPLSRDEIIERALVQAGDEWDTGPIDKNLDIDEIRTIRAPNVETKK
jgi:hypothetical protein